jgi:hypothetical protein
VVSQASRRRNAGPPRAGRRDRPRIPGSCGGGSPFRGTSGRGPRPRARAPRRRRGCPHRRCSRHPPARHTAGHRGPADQVSWSRGQMLTRYLGGKNPAHAVTDPMNSADRRRPHERKDGGDGSGVAAGTTGTWRGRPLSRRRTASAATAVCRTAAAADASALRWHMDCAERRRRAAPRTRPLSGRILPDRRCHPGCPAAGRARDRASGARTDGLVCGAARRPRGEPRRRNGSSDTPPTPTTASTSATRPAISPCMPESAWSPRPPALGAVRVRVCPALVRPP